MNKYSEATQLCILSKQLTDKLVTILVLPMCEVCNKQIVVQEYGHCNTYVL